MFASCRVVAFDKTGDLALLRFVNEISHEENGEVVPGFSEDAVCAFRSETAFGETVVAIGNPEGYGIALAPRDRIQSCVRLL